MNEAAYRRKVSQKLREMGCVVIPVVGTAAGGAGHPDCYVCSRQLSFWIEFKGLATPIKKIQTRMMAKLKERGDIVYVLRYPGLLQDEHGTTIVDIPDPLFLLQYLVKTHHNRRKDQ